jgi:hypothetical protein
MARQKKGLSYQTRLCPGNINNTGAAEVSDTSFPASQASAKHASNHLDGHRHFSSPAESLSDGCQQCMPLLSRGDIIRRSSNCQWGE